MTIFKALGSPGQSVSLGGATFYASNGFLVLGDEHRELIDILKKRGDAWLVHKEKADPKPGDGLGSFVGKTADKIKAAVGIVSSDGAQAPDAPSPVDAELGK